MSCQLMYVDSDGCPRAGAVCAHDRGEYIIRDASGGGPGDDRVGVFRLAAYDRHSSNAVLLPPPIIFSIAFICKRHFTAMFS